MQKEGLGGRNRVLKAQGGRGRKAPEPRVAGTHWAEEMGYVTWLGAGQNPEGLVDPIWEPVKGLRGGVVRVVVSSWA